MLDHNKNLSWSGMQSTFSCAEEISTFWKDSLNFKQEAPALSCIHIMKKKA